ncbi:hypothetical protein Sjap_009492 [Stephania japonica]|uniref:Uncharacterized protein n=1 Tax=Stephania japonica TaxID=461633 RepID=A0AAP0JRE9_9MAGN
MATALLSFVKNHWPFSSSKIDDLRLSDSLLSTLSIPEETKQFVFAISEPESNSIVYVLVAQNLSERSALDAEILIKEVRPDAVVAQVAPSGLTEIQLEEKANDRVVDDFGSVVPTSALGVLKGCFLGKFNKDAYESLAGRVVLREIFGVGFHGHFLAANRAAKEVGSSVLLLESPYVKTCVGESEVTNEGMGGKSEFQGLNLHSNSLLPQKISSVAPSIIGRQFHLESDLDAATVKRLASAVGLSSARERMSGSEAAAQDCLPQCDYQAPSFAQSVYPLLTDLHGIFNDLPSIGQALAYAQRMLYKVGKGEKIDSELLSGVLTFQVAVEGLRIGLNNAGRLPIGKLKSSTVAKSEFFEMTEKEKSHALLAQTIRSQTKKFKSIVAVVDASSLAGLRKHWDTPLPAEIEDMVETLVVEYGDTENLLASENSEGRKLMKGKPVVAVGAGATAVLGVSSFSKAVPASSFMKLLTIKVPATVKLSLAQTQKAVGIAFGKILGSSKVLAPGVMSSGAKSSSVAKAAASTEKIRAVAHSVIASAERTSFSVMRTSFYEIMRRRSIRPVGGKQWTTFGCSIATCAGLLVYGDGIECAVESIPTAPTVASLGRGLQSLHQASQDVGQTDRLNIQEVIKCLMSSLKKVKLWIPSRLGKRVGKVSRRKNLQTYNSGRLPLGENLEVHGVILIARGQSLLPPRPTPHTSEVEGPKQE